MATVHVLPEVSLNTHPEGALWSCYHKFGCQATTNGALEKLYEVTCGKNRLGRTKHRKVGFFYTRDLYIRGAIQWEGMVAGKSNQLKIYHQRVELSFLFL